MINKIFDKKGLILCVTSNPVIKLENMINGLDYLLKDKSLPRDLRIIENAYDVEMAYDIEETQIIVEKMHLVAQEYNSIRHAVIHNTPISTAYAMVLEQQKNIDSYLLGIFTTENIALKWVNDI